MALPWIFESMHASIHARKNARKITREIARKIACKIARENARKNTREVTREIARMQKYTQKYISKYTQKCTHNSYTRPYTQARATPRVKWCTWIKLMSLNEIFSVISNFWRKTQNEIFIPLNILIFGANIAYFRLNIWNLEEAYLFLRNFAWNIPWKLYILFMISEILMKWKTSVILLLPSDLNFH